MSKKLLFLYITSSFFALITLVIIGLTAKVIFGGLNINFLEQRLSSYLKNEHKIILKSDYYILRYGQDNGLYIDVSKADLLFSDKASFSANQIVIDFDLNDLFFSNEDQLITCLFYTSDAADE